MKITTVIGARPQFVKASFLSRRFTNLGVDERLLHTGQHYDENMSDVFFDELSIPKPALNLGVGGQNHGAQTGQMLQAIEEDLLTNRPDALLVYGDTNSTLAGGLAATKLHIPVIHIEAGLRSFDRKMPEEVNRILTDHISKLLLCPTGLSVQNLANEGIEQGVHLSGDVMHSVLFDLVALARESSSIISRLDSQAGSYYLATIHRAENTDDKENLVGIMNMLADLDESVVIPMHPRTKAKLESYGWNNTSDSLKIVEPLGYLDMLALIDGASMVLTDSGGLQKESVWLSKPCITLRDTTEWVETVESGWNILTGVDISKVSSAITHFKTSVMPETLQANTLKAEDMVALFEQINFN